MSEMTTDNFGVEVRKDDGQWEQFGPFVTTKGAAEKLLMSQDDTARVFEFRLAKPTHLLKGK